MPSLHERIALLKVQLKEHKATKVALNRELRVEKKRAARLRSKAAGLSAEDLQELIRIKLATAGGGSGAASSSAAPTAGGSGAAGPGAEAPTAGGSAATSGSDGL
jgi:hypothetical protein